VIAAAYYWEAAEIAESALADDIGAAGLPVAYAYVLGALALALAAQALVGSRRRGEHCAPERGARQRAVFGEVRKFARAAGLLVIGGAYLVAVPILGYALGIAAVLAAVAWYFGQRLTLRLALVVVAGGAVYFIVFVVLLGVDMPAGIWPGLR
jgi:hypothetical protein